MTSTPTAGSVAHAPTHQRIDSLDLVRGVATLGILLMNAVSFAFADAAYANLEAAGTETPVDTAIGVLGRIFVDQKMMALFSLLFGIGVAIFAERAEAKGRRPVGLSLWRNLLLLGIGLAHTLLWDGDILTVYAGCSVFVLVLRRLSARLLIGLGVMLANLAAVAMILLEGGVDDADLGEIWFLDGEMSDLVALLLFGELFGRALGLMLIGLGLYRLGVVQGRVGPDALRRLGAIGFGIGLPLSVAGLVVHTSTDWAADTALAGHALSMFGTVPLALGYLSVIVRWASRPSEAMHVRLQAVGRMALTNYLSQTVLGVLTFSVLLDGIDVTRTVVFAVILAIWTLQLAWSPWWLARYRFGPLEWLWRCATYRRWQPLRR